MSMLKLSTRTAAVTAVAVLAAATTHDAPSWGTEPATTSAARDEIVTSREVAVALARTPAELLVPVTSARGDRDSAAEAGGRGVAVEIPRDPEEAVTFGGVTTPVSVEIPQAESAGSAVTLGSGAVAYPGSDGSATAVLPAAGGGATQFATIIADPAATERYSYAVEIPDGARLVLTAGGGAEVRSSKDEVLMAVPAPWAKTADGAAVPTHFEISGDGGELTQVVEHHGLSTRSYPVVADPIWFAISGAVFWWAVGRCGAGGVISAVFAYVAGERSRRALAAAGAAGCLSSFVGGWGILRNLVRVVRW